MFKNIKRVLIVICIILTGSLAGACMIYTYMYDGHDLASQTRMVRRACREDVTLHSVTVLNPHTPETFKNSFGEEPSVEIVELIAADGQYGYAVFVLDEKGHRSLQSTHLYDRETSIGIYSTANQMYGIFQYPKPELEKVVVTVTNNETGESVTEEYSMNGYQIHVAELPAYKDCTIHSVFYDVYGNMYE